MATYQPERPTIAGVALTYHAAAAGDKVPPGVDLIVKNTNAATRDLTIVTPGTIYGQAIADEVVTVPALTGELHVRIPDEGFDAADGLVPLAWSATAGVTFAVVGR